MAKTFFDPGPRNFTRHPYTNNNTQQLTHSCLLLAANAVKNSLGNWAAGGFLHIPFEADPYKETYTNMYTQWKSIPELNKKQILQIHRKRIDRANGISRKGLAVAWWDAHTVIVDEDINK
ncbi:hypothetical protein BDD12DRAFT_895725 [Trichophaea hybrida]|nr:hypothetical protein BDD12DRAFT_895725 [Trichophaea hybrida]